MMNKIKTIFKDCRIVALAGIKHSGKTNNLVAIIKEFRDKDKETPIYVYGMEIPVMDYLKRFKVFEISSLEQLIKKRDCILILDEFQKLKLNDRRYKDELNSFIDFVYHNNIYVILCSPNIREFNSIIGGIIEKWLLKDIRLDQCINGSQLKKVVEKYKGRHKSLGNIDLKKNEILLINNEQEIILECEYIKKADSKKGIKKLF